MKVSPFPDTGEGLSYFHGTTGESATTAFSPKRGRAPVPGGGQLSEEIPPLVLQHWEAVAD